MSEIALSDSRELSMVDEEQLVTMMVDGQLFGIPILMVQDIVEPDQITPVPMAPGAIAGVLNLRGRIVTVIDMRELLGARGSDDDVKQMSVTVEYKGDLYTFLVDSIGDVRSIPRKSFDKAPSTLSEGLRRLCSGVFRLEDDLLVVLDVDRMLEEETIMKTPRRTRRRRNLGAKQPVSNQNKTEGAEAETDEDDAGKKLKGAEDSQVKETSSKGANKAKDTKPAVKAPNKKASAAKAKTAEKPKAAVSHAAVADSDNLAMQAVENFAARVEDNSILRDLFSNINDSDLLDLLVNLFNATFGMPSAPSLQDAYLKFIDQPNLGDDHYMSAGTALHTTLTEVKADVTIVDSVMQVVDSSRSKVLDV